MHAIVRKIEVISDVMDINQKTDKKRISAIARFLFLSRWLQLPLYLGLVLAQCIYVFHFWVELTDLLGAIMGDKESLKHILHIVSPED